MKIRSSNKRRFLLNSKFQLIFGIYTFFTMIFAIIVIVRDYIQIFVPVFMSESAASNIGIPLKILLLPGWVIISFLVFYLYLNARVLGVFQRINDTCERIILGDNVLLTFRKKDSFRYLSDTFNEMVEGLKSREKKLFTAVLRTRERLSLILKENKNVQQEIKDIIKDIDTVTVEQSTEKNDEENPNHS